MKLLRIASVVGARPNFMKIAPFAHAIAAHNGRPEAQRGRAIEHRLIHTGQHYDANMSDQFFRTLGLPAADVHLGVGSGTHAEQVGRTMIALEQSFREWRPDWVVVVGDVNATCAGAITAKKEWLRVAHIEAGLRSFDLTMPEEINRMVTDRLSDLLLTPDPFADENLRREGAAPDQVRRVGNIMIDTLEAQRESAALLSCAATVTAGLLDGQPAPDWLAETDRAGTPFAVITLHRPSNVDQPESLKRLVDFFIGDLSPRLPVIWAIHPRTHGRMATAGLLERVLACREIALVQPLGYREMLKLNMCAALFLTDSGGLQEECCVLGTPCITMRPTTERPITLEEHGGVSRLVGCDIGRIDAAVTDMLKRGRRPFRPPLWDGKTAPRVVQAIVDASEA